MLARPLDPAVATALTLANHRVSVLCSPDGVVRWMSPNTPRLLGWEPDELVGTSVFDLYDAASRPYSERGFAQARREPEAAAEQLGSVARTAWVRHRDGRHVLVESYPSSMLLVPEVEGVLLEWVAGGDQRLLLRAVDDLALGRPAAATLASVAQLVEAQLPEVAAGVAVLDGDRWELVVPPGGRAAAPLLAAMPAPDDPRWYDEFLLLDADALASWAGPECGVGLAPLRADGADLLGAMILVRRRADRLPIVVTGGENRYTLSRHLAVLTLAAHRRACAERAAAERDPLTGLGNRIAFERAVNALMTAPDDVTVAVAYLDLDGLKEINDRLGHAVGDEVLRSFGHRLATALRPDDIACRIGGDEFVVACVGAFDDAAGVALARRLAAVTDAVPIDGHLSAGASVGVAVGPAFDVNALCALADERLYAAKRSRQRQRIRAIGQ